jgi:hypothetical protein
MFAAFVLLIAGQCNGYAPAPAYAGGYGGGYYPAPRGYYYGNGNGYGGYSYPGPRGYSYGGYEGPAVGLRVGARPLLSLNVGRDRRYSVSGYDDGRGFEYQGRLPREEVYYGRPFVIEEGYGPPPYARGAPSGYGYGGYGNGYEYSRGFPPPPRVRESYSAAPRYYDPD